MPTHLPDCPASLWRCCAPVGPSPIHNRQWWRELPLGRVCLGVLWLVFAAMNLFPMVVKLDFVVCWRKIVHSPKHHPLWSRFLHIVFRLVCGRIVEVVASVCRLYASVPALCLITSGWNPYSALSENGEGSSCPRVPRRCLSFHIIFQSNNCHRYMV